MNPFASAQLTVVPPSSAAVASELRCSGAWSVQTIANLESRLAEVRWPSSGDIVVDGSALTALDTSGA